MFPPAIRKYQLISLTGAPHILETLLKGWDDNDPRWDVRLDPDRFTLREMIAHLADWEPIHAERIRKICTEDMPELPDIDEGALAVTNNYAASVPSESLRRFSEGRAALMAQLKSLSDAQWERQGNRILVGIVSVETYMTLTNAHDGYHFVQTADYLSKLP